MLERTDSITNEVLEPITFVLAYPTVCSGGTNCQVMMKSVYCMKALDGDECLASQDGRFTPGEKGPDTHWKRCGEPQGRRPVRRFTPETPKNAARLQKT